MREPAVWEREGKSPIVAALVTSSLVMALYGFVGSLVGNAAVIASTLRDEFGGLEKAAGASGGLVDMIVESYKRYQGLILGLTVALQFLVFVGLTVFLFRKWHGKPIAPYFRINRPRPLSLLLSLAGLAFVLPLALGLGELATRAFPILKELDRVGNALVSAETPTGLVLLVLAIGVTPALCEEFLFRGYLHRTLSRRLPEPWSYIVSGVFFALIHQNYFGLATLILVGVYLGFVFSRFDSIWPGVLVHFAYNTTLVVMVNKPEPFAWLQGPDGFVKPIVLLVSALGAAGIVYLIVRSSAGIRLRPDAQDAAPTLPSAGQPAPVQGDNAP